MTRQNDLNKIRRSRVLDYGPGSIIDFTLEGSGVGSISVVSAGLDYWDVSSKKNYRFDKQTINEDRLKKQLRVNGFRLPPVNDDNDKDSEKRVLWGFRFPKYLMCPRCRIIKLYSQWEDVRIGDPQKICTSCSDEEKKIGRTNNIFVVPTRFVVACKNGHLNDFPWFLWVHGKDKDGKCKFDFSKNTFKLSSSGEDMGLSGLVLECLSCNKKRPLDGIYSELKGIKCSGSMPWLKDKDGFKDFREDCDLEIEPRQRGSGDLYKPQHLSSLTIPPFDEKSLEILHEANLTIDDLFKPNFSDDTRIEFLRISLSPHGITDLKEIKEINEKIKYIKSYLDVKKPIYWEEYLTFTNRFEISAKLKNYKPNIEKFEIREQIVDKELTKYLDKLVKVVRLRVTKALVGFTRIIEPLNHKDTIKNPKTDKEYRQGRLYKEKPTWLPAIEIKGEGIFISLNENRLSKWEKDKALVKRSSKLNDYYSENLNNKESEDRLQITPRFLLVHTLSHALISELAKTCGYNEASLTERLYISDKKDEKMSGILIYTSSSDSEGTLGGLSRQADPNRFKNTFLNAIQSKHNCSQDPHCIMGIKSASERYNHAACHSCLLLPETCCPGNWNRFLDRAVIRGDIDNEFKSFFDF